MGGVEPHHGGAALVMGLKKARGAEAPLIARFQAGKLEFRVRRAEVVADILGKGQKFSGHHRADRMAAVVRVAGVAMAVAEKAGERLGRAGFQSLTQNITGLIHDRHWVGPFASRQQSGGVWA